MYIAIRISHTDLKGVSMVSKLCLGLTCYLQETYVMPPIIFTETPRCPTSIFLLLCSYHSKYIRTVSS